MPEFCHLHNHTQFSLLDGSSEIEKLLDKAKADGQKAVAITDHGNMFGAFKFVSEAKKRGIKPIVGCEFYMVEDSSKKKFERSKGERDRRYHQLMIAKNEEGYKNLSKLASLGFTEGKYGKFPRIDRPMIEKYHKGLIATSCCLGAEIPQAILKGQNEKAEELVIWWKDLLGDDFYIELQRQGGLENIDGTGVSQEHINQELIKLAKKFEIKTIVTNDAHYVDQEDSQSHDVLLSINTGSLLADEKRFRFSSNDYFFKTQNEMNSLFSDVPYAVEQTIELSEKVDTLDLKRDVVLPKFPIPKGFHSEIQYLRFLSYEGAKKRWGELSPLVTERLDFELDVIEKSGYPGYFLIVQDFTKEARRMGVVVGPGRGSAAGSAVAYCLAITNIDPIKYDLLFERFLNPERISMPDIDIDFDDHGRSKIIDYVRQKYGENQVAQIITYGTMAAKMSLRDVGRVLDIPIPEVNRVAKAYPTHAKASLNALLGEDGIDKKLWGEMSKEDKDKATQFRKLSEGNSPLAKMIQTAKSIEGSVRNTGVHACGVIITPQDVTNYVPVATGKDMEIISQFDNNVVEDAGLLKMDFLGLKTLSIIKDAVDLVHEGKGIEIDIDEVDLEDEKTYQLFQKGDTVGIFQYESPGMQKHLKSLKPNKFEDLIAMNALYRPGPLQYIPEFIDRKHGKKPIVYDDPQMEEYLAETYGITVYQEQVMLLSQKLAGFSKGQADKLRKGMGKKQKHVIDELYPLFLEGCVKNGLKEEVINKIWKDWEAFASYAFNKSHSTCYALVAFQTAYMKAHYPSEFIAATLNHNKKDITKIYFFLREAKRLSIEVLGPDVNESALDFTVNKKEEVRFGLSALKGVGEGPVSELMKERKENGPFDDVFDIAKRVNLRSVNKKSFESMAYGGAFDTFEKFHRAQYFALNNNSETGIEAAIKYGHAYQKMKSNNQMSLFGDMDDSYIDVPSYPEIPEWSLTERLEKEKEVTGIYISGHPLDDYKLELDNFVTCTLANIEHYKDQRIGIAGLVTKAIVRQGDRGADYGSFTIEDFDGAFSVNLRGETYQKFANHLQVGKVVYINGVHQKGYNTDQYFFKVNDVKLLDTIGKNRVQSITLKIDVDNLDENLIEKLKSISMKHRGKNEFRMVLLDYTDQHKMTFKSGSKKLKVDNDLLKELDKLPLTYKIN